MLAAHEFSIGSLRDPTSLTLLWPRHKYEHAMLVTKASGTLTAIFLEGQYSFRAFACADNDSWKGLLIPGIEIEVDETTVFDLDRGGITPGTAVRKGTELCISARSNDGYSSAVSVPVIGDLPPVGGGYMAGFRKWRIVLGEGAAKRELKIVEISETAQE